MNERQRPLQPRALATTVPCGFRHRRVLKPRRESVEKRDLAMRYLNVRKPTKALSRLSDNNESKPALPRGTIGAIGRELRQMYAEIIAEGVPERFAEILRRLDEPGNEASKNEPRGPTL